MTDLPLLELPGLLRPVNVPLLREVAMPLPPPGPRTRLHLRQGLDGTLTLRWKGQREVVRWDPGSDQLQTLELAAGEAGHWGLDVRGDRLAVAGPASLQLLDGAGAVLRQHRFPEANGENSCRLGADGSLWHLADLDGGRARLRLLDAAGELLDQRELTHRASGGPAWWLEDAHPTQPTVAVSAGLGQDGAFFLLAHARERRLVLDAPVDGSCFAGWAPGGEAFATLPHHGTQLCLWSLGGAPLRQRELRPMLEALDDGHSWSVCFLDDERLLLPTSEGRLLLVRMAGGEALELRLRGDVRNWDWRQIGLVRLPGSSAPSLLTARSGDRALKVWDLTACVR